MLSWHVEIDRKSAELYSFPDFHYQNLLLPYLGTGNVEIDEYGRSVYQGEELKRLRLRIQHIYDYFEAKPVQWEITQTEYDHSRLLSVDKYVLERKVVLLLLDKLLAAIGIAQNTRGALVFLGD